MKNNIHLLNWICEQYSKKEVTEAMIDYCWNDCVMQLKYEEEMGNVFYKLDYPLTSEPLPVYPQWEVDFIKNNIK